MAHSHLSYIWGFSFQRLCSNTYEKCAFTNIDMFHNNVLIRRAEK